MQIEGVATEAGGDRVNPVKVYGTFSMTQAGPLTDHSGAITLGGTAQVLMQENPERKYLMLQNLSDTIMYVNLAGGTASAGAGSFALPVNGAPLVQETGFVTTSEISIFCATTGKEFSAVEG